MSDNNWENLGFGGFATVKLIRHKDNMDILFAVKKIKKGNKEENKYIE